MRVVLDTNVFISMTLGGYVGEINTAWKTGKFTLVISDAILSEYLDVLQRPKLHLTADVISALLGRIQRKTKFVTPKESIHIINSDDAENMFLEAALEGKAVFVVSGDNHLLELKSFRGIEIISVRDFLEKLK